MQSHFEDIDSQKYWPRFLAHPVRLLTYLKNHTSTLHDLHILHLAVAQCSTDNNEAESNAFPVLSMMSHFPTKVTVSVNHKDHYS